MESFKSVDEDGTIRYKNEKGLFHREDGPAYENPNGYRVWYKMGKYHREDGPAIEYSDGSFRYYLNDEFYDKEDYEREIIKLKLNRIKDL